MKRVRIKAFPFKEKQLELFWYWINERHSIYLKKQAGEPWPWTKDKILQHFKFTNPFRQNDRVTQEWTKRYATALGQGKKLSDGDLLFQCAMFRLFNLPETYDALYYGMGKWNVDKAIKILKIRRDEEKKQIFTGAYIVTPGGGSDKVETYCRVLDMLYDGRTKDQVRDGKAPKRDEFASRIRGDFYREQKRPSMQRAVNVLMRLPTVGGFIGYEIACDLRHTRLLVDAYDVRSWANPGPGAVRGINRLLTGQAKLPKGTKKPDYVKAMRSLLRMTEKKSLKTISKDVRACEWPFESREIEHSLCEFDKHSRVRLKEGKPRSIYKPHSENQLDLPF